MSEPTRTAGPCGQCQAEHCQHTCTSCADTSKARAPKEVKVFIKTLVLNSYYKGGSSDSGDEIILLCALFNLLYEKVEIASEEYYVYTPVFEAEILRIKKKEAPKEIHLSADAIIAPMWIRHPVKEKYVIKGLSEAIELLGVNVVDYRASDGNCYMINAKHRVLARSILAYAIGKGTVPHTHCGLPMTQEVCSEYRPTLTLKDFHTERPSWVVLMLAKVYGARYAHFQVNGLEYYVLTAVNGGVPTDVLERIGALI
jgi:hypothetical protein